MDTCRVITISRECGSRGKQVAEALSQALGFDLFHYEIVESMIKEAQNSKVLLETLDDLRRKVVQNAQGLNAEDAQKMMVSTDANRTAFIRRYFNADAQDPANYDLILNTGTLSVEKAVSIIQSALA